MSGRFEQDIKTSPLPFLQMGVQITELLPKKEIKLESLSGKVIAIDGYNHLYQFLTTIRTPDGAFFTDSRGNVTSHLIGLFTRTAHLMKLRIKPAYVFDGEVPALKKLEIRRRAEIKEAAEAKFAEAQKSGRIIEMKKYAVLSTKLTRGMVNDAKDVASAMGLPVIQAPGEGEAQAAFIVSKGNAFAVASQDADSLLFGANRVIRNLSIDGRRRQAGTLAYSKVEPELITLEEVTSSLGITRRQLIFLSMLVGTDYNTRGIKGIGPQKALKLVKEKKTPEEIFHAAKWSDFFNYPWQDVLDLFEKPVVTREYDIKFLPLNKKLLFEILCEKHDFSRQRVEKTIEELEESTSSKKQKGLGDFF